MPSGLATRCTACATVFRVVPDQLRVSEGWVRCGRCAEVFNAAEHLLDMESGAPRRLGDEPSASPPAPPPLPPRAPERLYDPRHDVADLGSQQRSYDDRGDGTRAPVQAPSPLHPDAGPPAYPPDPPDAPSRWRPVEAAPAPHHLAPARRALGAPATNDPVEAWHDDEPVHPMQQPPAGAPIDDIGARFDAQAVDSSVSISGDAAEAADLADLRATPWGSPDTPPARDKTPSFLRRADRAQRWRQPRVRAALWAVTLLAGLGLAAQVVFSYRDLAAARFTFLRPALEQVCGWLACSVGEAHAIDSLVVDSSGLVRVEKSSIYKLSVALRNRAAIAVAVPAVEIALTDAQGKLLARRVLRATELGAAQPALAAGRDLALQATLQAATEPVAGYTIELFYP